MGNEVLDLYGESDRQLSVWESATRDAAQFVIPAMRQSLSTDPHVLAHFVVWFADSVTEAWLERKAKFEAGK